MTMRKIQIVEVGPRDGFQPIKDFIPTEQKFEFIDRLYAAGIRRMEAGAFVSTSAVPQMADAPEILAHCARYADLDVQMLVPTNRQAERALQAGAGHIAFVMSASPAHNQSNVRHTPEESVEEFALLVSELPSEVKVRINLATSFDCPFDGPVAQDAVLQILARLSFDPAIQVPSNGRMISVASALAESYEICALTPRFIEGWSKLAFSPELEALQSDDQARIAFMHANHVIDVIRQYPLTGVSAEEFISLLRPLQPRLYSIASSQRVTAREVHLTVAPVEYELQGEARRGVATGQLVLRAPVGSQVQVYIQPNEHFRLPAPTTPIIMIGPGTGIAPFRGFLQERSCETLRGKAWLLFGERNREFDFLYREELEGYLSDGILTRLDTAFSRDGNEKVYVQHRIAEHSDDIVAWIDAGAHIYICGDAGMANDVHDAIVQALARSKQLDAGGAENILNTMRRAKRYQRDVY